MSAVRVPHEPRIGELPPLDVPLKDLPLLSSCNPWTDPTKNLNLYPRSEQFLEHVQRLRDSLRDEVVAVDGAHGVGLGVVEHLAAGARARAASAAPAGAAAVN